MYLRLKLPVSFWAMKATKSSVIYQGGHKIDRAVANQIATGIRAWAESKGVALHSLVPAAHRYYVQKNMIHSLH